MENGERPQEPESVSSETSDSQNPTAEEPQKAENEAVEASAKKPADDAVEPAGKPTTLFQALGDQGNRDVAKHFASFSAALAAVPVLGLFAAEWALRSFVAEAGTRWIYGGVVAVALVNVVLMAFVVWCFAEGFPDADGKSQEKLVTDLASGGAKGEATLGDSAGSETKKSK
eukprot:s98_g37.t1